MSMEPDDKSPKECLLVPLPALGVVTHNRSGGRQSLKSDQEEKDLKEAEVCLHDILRQARERVPHKYDGHRRERR
jgi:hypothetical protein